MYDDCIGTNYERYNCADYSHDFTLILRKGNFTTYPVCGYVNHIHHAWVGVVVNNTLIQIEPQTGQIVQPSGLEYARGMHCMVRGLS